MSRHFRIHPAIGTARMGNSPEHFIGPETPSVQANSNGGVSFKSFRDSQGQILRQGAQFRVFEYDETPDGKISNPREVKIGDDIVDVEWRVHLANRKASFFSFYGQVGAADLYDARLNKLSPDAPIKLPNDAPPKANRRNATVVSPADRAEQLEIDPGEKLISQRQTKDVELLNTKKNIPIDSLGTLRLGENGRLIVCGGYGQSNSTQNPPPEMDEYANNDTWFDDASDGSVKARIVFKDGTVNDADPAWVLIGPPDFAPGIGNVVSLRDTLWDLAVRVLDSAPLTTGTDVANLLQQQRQAWQNNNGKSLAGFKPSFLRDIYPLINRAFGARDVHVSGTTAGNHYHQKLLQNYALMSTIEGDGADDAQIVRESIFAWLRNPEPNILVAGWEKSTPEWDKMPRGLGDDYTSLDQGHANNRSFLSLTPIQFAILEQFKLGNFINDWPSAEPSFLPKADPTPDELDIAATENSVGGPFYPGIEVSWLIRTKALYSEPFRLNIPREPEIPNAPYPKIPIGALFFMPGFFSQQMALPWQADFYDCQKENHQDPGDKDKNKDYWFMWWTAQRPDDTYPPGGVEPQRRWVKKINDPTKSDDQNDNDNARFFQMQQNWFKLPFVSVWRGDHYEEEPNSP